MRSPVPPVARTTVLWWLAWSAACGDATPPSPGTGAPATPQGAGGIVIDLDVSERAALAAERDLLAALERWHREERDAPPYAGFSRRFAARFSDPSAALPVPDEQLELRRLVAADDSETLDAGGLLDLLRAHLGREQRIRYLDLELSRFFLQPDERHAAGRLELVVFGEDPRAPDGARARLDASCDVELTLVGGQGWQLDSLVLLSGNLVAGTVPRFRDVTGATGLDFNDSAENRAILQQLIDRHMTLAVGGLTVLDWNRDGFEDLLCTRKAQLTTLFLNDGRGGFLPHRQPVHAPQDSPTFLLWLDLDGDGIEELASTRVGAYEGERAFAPLYTRVDGEWVERPRAFELPVERGRRRLSIHTIVPFDADGDDDIDLFFGVYGDALSRGDEYNTIDARDGARNYLLLNHSGLEFSEESAERGLSGTRYTYVAEAFDFDGDGDTDLFEGDDFGPNTLWENDGTGHFTAAPSPLAEHSTYTMGVSLADPDSDGSWSLYVVNMSSRVGERIIPLVEDVEPAMRERMAVIASGNMLFQQGPDGTWRERAAELHCNEAEWAWGSVFFDLDNDGDEDLYVTNGFTSHSSPELPDWSSYYWRQVAADARALERGEPSTDANAGHPFEGSFDGYQRDRLFYNPGLGRSAEDGWFDAAWVFGTDASHDGRCVAPIDVDGDGDLDLALYTLDGLRLLENRAEPRSFARVRVRATRSEAQALGAVVEVTAGGLTRRGRVHRTDGFQTQVSDVLHFGLGDAERIEELRVHWPSGETETWNDLPVDRLLEVREGAAAVDVREVPRWPDATRPIADARPEAQVVGARPGTRMLLVHFPDTAGERRPWDELAGEEVRWIVVTEDGADDPQPSGPATFVPTNRAIAHAFFGSRPAPPRPATFVFDSTLALKRAFLRPVEADELRRLLVELQDEPLFPDPLLLRGRRALDEYRYRDALRNFQGALMSAPDMVSAFDGMGQAYTRLGQPELAEAAYERAIEVDPDYALGHFNLGVTRLHLGRPEEALAPIQEALAIGGEDGRMLLTLGEAAAAAGDLELALDAFTRARRASPDSPDAHLLAAKALGQLERYAEARRAAQRALELDPDLAEARRLLRRLESLGE